MSSQQSTRVRTNRRIVVGPDGAPLSLADLPPAGATRWVVRRKAMVVAAVRGGLLSIGAACERYQLTMDEFMSWQRSLDEHGMMALRVTRAQDYRPGAVSRRRRYVGRSE
jgi:Protein of unknown function (DUF1153)